jgi:DNA-directed RNA polymerase subunit RPC12/RpoP
MRCKMSKAISEETKQKISELYRTSDLSTASISQALGVSERTAQRYKNYDGLDTSRPTRPSETSPTSPSSHDKALDITGKSRPTSQGDQALEGSGEPSRNETDQALDVTERSSQTRPDNEMDEEPRGIKFVGGRKHIPEKTIDEEEFEYKCEKCGAEFNMLNHGKCPNCGVKLDLEIYAELTGNSDEKEEFEYECPHCHYEFNSRSDTCPSCGGSLSGYDD